MKVIYRTIIITFSKGIEQLNEIFEDDTQAWGVSTLKQWIDSYEEHTLYANRRKHGGNHL